MNCWWGALVHFQWESKTVPPLWKTGGQLHKHKLTIWPSSSTPHQTRTQIFIAALFTTVQSRNWPKGPMDCYSTVKRNELVRHETTWMSLTLPCWVKARLRIDCKLHDSIFTKQQNCKDRTHLWLPGPQPSGGDYFRVMEISSLLMVPVGTQLYTSDLSHQILCLQLLSFMVCKCALIILIFWKWKYESLQKPKTVFHQKI